VSGRAAEHRTIEEEQRMSDRLVWIDCEMTGLDLGSDLLIEVAALVTDSELNLLGEGIDIVIGADAEQLSRMPDVVREMHASSGLTDEVLASTVTLQEAEQQVLAYIQQYVPEPKKAPLCGNSIATDRGFITRDMPVLDEWLHYRMVDVSSVKELARRWYPRAYFNAPKKGGGHRALADIEESVQELKYYRAAVFVPQPGPTSGQAAELAAQLSAGDVDGASRLPAASEVVPD
jgi:oligoribonuclease